MLAVLWALFFRPAGFDYRSKLDSSTWRRAWDWGLFVAGSVPPIIFGVAFGNLLLGVPFSFDSNMVSTYTGSFWQLLNPFALLCGAVSSSMITLHGASYLAHRTEGAIHDRARRAARFFSALLLIAFSVAGIWLASAIDGYAITSTIDPSAPANPIGKTVIREAGAWLGNYRKAPLTLLLPVLVYAGALACVALIGRGRTALAFLASSLAITGVIATAAASMFPFVLPSSSVPGASLTVWDGVSSRLTLSIMLVATLIFIPIIIFYTSWAYRVMAARSRPHTSVKTTTARTDRALAARGALPIDEEQASAMWYFSWGLGIGFAVLLAILNALWGENEEARDGPPLPRPI